MYNISNMYSRYMSEYTPLDQDLRQFQARSTFIAQYPRYLIEFLMISIITSIAFLIGKIPRFSPLLLIPWTSKLLILSFILGP